MTAQAATARTRWGFRGRLAISIAATFIVLGILLVGIQFFILFQAFQTTITLGSDGAGPIDTTGVVTDGCISAPTGVACSDGDGPLTNYGHTLAGDVMQLYLLWSVILLGIFAVIAAVLAWLLTRRPARTIGGISALAGDISEHDLSRRLNLQGPRDEITDLGDRFDIMLARLDEAFTSQERFVANASHELRTPVTAARAALEAPLSQDRVPAELQPYVQRALRANQRMDDLITALLLLARSRHLGSDDLSEVDLMAMVSGTLDDLSEPISAKHLVIAVEIPSAPPPNLQANRAALSISVLNLLTNAIQHNRDHGRIKVSMTSEGPFVVLTVSNSGPRYAPEEVHDLIQPFNRGAYTRQAGTPGTGLGLTIIESVARVHGGRFELSADTPDGLTVSLKFPVADGVRRSAPSETGTS